MLDIKIPGYLGTMRTIIAVAVTTILTACVTPIPFSTITLGGSPTVISEHSALIETRTGSVRAATGSMLMPIGGAFIAVPAGFMADLAFGEMRQNEFADLLRSELIRLKVFNSVSIKSPNPADINIELFFIETIHRESHQAYELDVGLRLSGKLKSRQHRFKVNSLDDLTWFQKITTTAPEGSARAAHMLLKLVVPAIQAYVADAYPLSPSDLRQ